jgi:hypothetical protein
MAGKDDVQSDPSLDDGESADWSAEGGATPEGPATDPDAADDKPDDHQELQGDDPGSGGS